MTDSDAVNRVLSHLHELAIAGSVEALEVALLPNLDRLNEKDAYVSLCPLSSGHALLSVTGLIDRDLRCCIWLATEVKSLIK